jgi:arabinan endo-1,5-alpha-L-arabinosidase
VLIQDAPDGDFTVETRLDFRLPPDYTNRAFQQAGLVLYENDDSYIKLAHVGIFNTRQTEFAKEVPEPIVSGARYGNTVVGPPADVTYLRIVREVNEEGGVEEYTAYTRQEGERWVRGGTWTHELGEDVRIGLVSMGDCCNEFPPVNADFDYVRVYRP